MRLSHRDVLMSGDLCRILDISHGTLQNINRTVDLMPFHRGAGGRRFWLKAHLPLLVERIYVADNGLRPHTLAKIMTGLQRYLFGEITVPLQGYDFKRVNGRWVLR